MPLWERALGRDAGLKPSKKLLSPPRALRGGEQQWRFRTRGALLRPGNRNCGFRTDIRYGVAVAAATWGDAILSLRFS
jgi:hypothetical protein